MASAGAAATATGKRVRYAAEDAHTHAREADDTEADGQPVRRPRMAGAAAAAAASAPRAAGAAADAGGYGTDEEMDIDSRAHTDTQADEDDDEDMDVSIDPSEDTRQAGQVTRVFMKNLRCHKFMEVKPQPRVNFITGANGSGKSTILTAIRLALGWNPPKIVDSTSTSKGSTGYAAIIRDGSDGETIVEVDFTNHGVDAVEPEKFGSLVRIRRIISRSNAGNISNKYEIYNMDKPTEPKLNVDARAAVSQLADGWSVDPTNPVLIMDQETSKRFLQGSAKDQYKFFFEATLLRKNFEKNQELIEQLSTMKAHLEAKKVAIAKLEAEKKRKFEEYQRVEELLNLKTQVKHAENDLLWAAAHDRERQAQHKLEAAQQEFAKMDHQAAKIDAVKAHAEIRRKEYEEASEKLTAAQTAVSAVTQQIEELEKEIAAQKQPMMLARRAEAAAQRKVKDAEADVKRAQTALDDFMAELEARDVDSERVRRQRTIDAVAKKKAAAESRLRDVEAERTDDDPVTEAVTKLRRCQGTVRDLEQELNAVVANIKRATATNPAERDPWLPFQTSKFEHIMKTRRIINELCAAGKIKTRPLDPLALHVRAQAEWLRAVETIIGPRASNFVLSSPADAALVEAEGRKQHVRISYMVKAKTARLADDRLSQLPGLRRMLDVVAIEDDWAFNTLVDELDIDNVAVAASVPDAEKTAVLQDARGAKYLKSRAKSVVIADGRIMTAKGSGVTIRAAVADDSAPPGIIRPMREEDILPALRSREAALHSSIAAAKEELRAAEREHNAAKTAAQRLQQRINDAQRQLDSAEKEYENALSIPEPDDDDDESMTKRQELDVTLQGATVRLLQAQKSLAEAVAALHGPKAHAEDMMAKHGALVKQLENNDEVNAAEKEVNEKQRAYKDIVVSLDTFQRKFEDARATAAKKVAEAEEGVNHVAAELQDLVAKTGMPAARDPELSESEARARLKGIQTALKKQTHQYSDEELQAIHLAKKISEQAYKVENDLYQEVVRNYDRLKAEKNARKKQWLSNRERLGKLVSRKFRLLMKEKGFIGKLQILHGDVDDNPGVGKMIVMVAPDKEARYGAQSQGLTQADVGVSEDVVLQEVGALSGGEKSVSTLLLMAAIASVCSVPMRIIDEFDVYQDEANRKFSMQMLMDLATRADAQGRYSQYLLLTPHDISSAIVPKAGEVEILRLKKPDRNGLTQVAGGASEDD